MNDSVSKWVYALLLSALVVVSGTLVVSFPRSGVLWASLIVSAVVALLSRRSAAGRAEVFWDADGRRRQPVTLSQVARPVPPPSVHP